MPEWQTAEGIESIKQMSIPELVQSIAEDAIGLPMYRHERGDTVLVACRISQDLKRMIDVFRSQKDVPHETNSDVLRDALFLYVFVLRAKYNEEESSEWRQQVREIATAQRVRDLAALRGRALDFAANTIEIGRAMPREAAKQITDQHANLKPRSYAARMYYGALQKQWEENEELVKAIKRHLGTAAIEAIEEADPIE